MVKKMFYTTAVALLLIAESIFAIGSLYARRPLSSDSYFPLWLKKYDENR